MYIEGEPNNLDYIFPAFTLTPSGLYSITYDLLDDPGATLEVFNWVLIVSNDRIRIRVNQLVLPADIGVYDFFLRGTLDDDPTTPTTLDAAIRIYITTPIPAA